MSAWEQLHKHHTERRAKHGVRLTEIQSSLIGRLMALADLDRCDRELCGWFSTKNGKLALTEAAPIVADRPAIPFRNLEHIDDAHLTLVVTFDPRGRELQGYSIQLRGVRRVPTAPKWYARVDLDETARGVGLCSHALLHTHVGTTPEDDDVSSNDPHEHRKKFSTRVPAPWLAPIDALNWLLASVDRSLELHPTP